MMFFYQDRTVPRSEALWLGVASAPDGTILTKEFLKIYGGRARYTCVSCGVSHESRHNTWAYEHVRSHHTEAMASGQEKFTP